MSEQKPKVAFYWCASCGGCEEAVVDLAEKVLDVVAAVDIVFWPVALDFKREDVEAMDDGSILASFINGALESVFGKPWAMKGLILELNIPFLSSILDKALFLFVRRHPFYNIQSLLEARVRYFGDRRAWYSIKPRESELLVDLDPIDQVAGQVYLTKRGIQQGLDQIEAARTLVVEYEDFCSNPKLVFDQIVARFHQQGVDVRWEYEGPGQFKSANKVRLPEQDCARIVAACQRWPGLEIGPGTPHRYSDHE